MKAKEKSFCAQKAFERRKLLLKKSSNKLRMKALVGWNILFQVPELINVIVFFTRIKNDMDKEDKIAWDLN